MNHRVPLNSLARLQPHKCASVLAFFRNSKSDGQNVAISKGEGQRNWRDRGSDGLLPAPPHDPSGHTWHHPDEQLFAITKLGLAKLINQPEYRTAMPIYDGVLSDDEIVAALSWIKAQWPPEIQRRHDEINVQYRQSLSR